MRERLRSKEFWVVGADRFRNPDEDLSADFETNRAVYYEALKRTNARLKRFGVDWPREE